MWPFAIVPEIHEIRCMLTTKWFEISYSRDGNYKNNNKNSMLYARLVAFELKHVFCSIFANPLSSFYLFDAYSADSHPPNATGGRHAHAFSTNQFDITFSIRFNKIFILFMFCMRARGACEWRVYHVPSVQYGISIYFWMIKRNSGSMDGEKPPQLISRQSVGIL